MTCIGCGKKMTRYDVRMSHNGVCAKCQERRSEQGGQAVGSTINPDAVRSVMAGIHDAVPNPFDGLMEKRVWQCVHDRRRPKYERPKS